MDSQVEISIKNLSNSLVRLLKTEKSQSIFKQVTDVFNALFGLTKDFPQITPWSCIDAEFNRQVLETIGDKNCKPQDYLSCIDFLTTCAQDSEGAQKVFEMKIISWLCKIEMFRKIESCKKYNSSSRNTTHILWIRTLFLLRQLAFMLIKNSGMIHSFLEFFKTYQEWFFKVLNFEGYKD